MDAPTATRVKRIHHPGLARFSGADPTPSNRLQIGRKWPLPHRSNHVSRRIKPSGALQFFSQL